MENNISYSEYIAERIDSSIVYSEYLAEQIDNSIVYSEYLAEQIDNNISYNSDYSPIFTNRGLVDLVHYETNQQLRYKKVIKILDEIRIRLG